jgi:Tfp pilus assembly protein PilN
MTTPTAAAPGAPAPGPLLEPGTVPAPRPARPRWALVPQVNLLPSEILDARRFRTLQRRLAVVALSVVVLCGLGVVRSQVGVVSARHDLGTIQVEGARLRAQQARYADVPTALAELDRVKAARETALATDVAWYQFLTDLAVNTPAGTQLTSVTIAMDGRSSAADSLLTPAGLGTVTLQGTALKFPDVAAWLEAVDRVHGLAGSGLSSAVREGGGTGSSGTGPSGTGSSGTGSHGTGALSGITFNGTAVIVPAALSHRYDRKAA